MASGGARSRSGPRPDPTSKRSEKRKVAATPTAGAVRVLPREGYDGKVPTWPLPKKPAREVALWKKIWKYPQAAAWAENEWQHMQIAQYVHWLVKAEAPDAPASTLTSVMRLADAIGLTPAGLRENGWTIGEADPVEDAVGATPVALQPTRRLRVVDHGSK